MAQADPPGRVGRLNHAEGPVIFSAAGDNEWTDAEANRPLTRGDRIWTDRGSRAELQVGSSAVRLDSQSRLEILALDDQSAQLSLTQGSIYVRVRSLPEGENFEIDTPNLAYRAAYPGDYRIDVDTISGTTRVTIHSGTGAVYGEGGQVLPLGGGQQVTFRTRTLAQVNAQESPPQDAFDRWAADRNRREDQSVAARYVPREVVGYQQLDAHGQWSQDPTHGPVWIPQGTPANWAPYRQGHWEWISPWGWTWIDAAPWGFAPFHYGRWTMIGARWAWVPGRIGLRPVYAPALVAFIGGSSGGIDWATALGGGRPGVAWFPLAPGEAWQPGYRASPVYMSNVNRNIAVQPNATYAHQRRPEALTAISAEDFHRGQPVRGNWLRVAANTLSNAQVVPPPPMPERSERQHAGPARAAPPPQAEIRQVAASTAPPRRDEAADRAQREREIQAQAAAAQKAQAVAAQQAQAVAAQKALAEAAAQAKVQALEVEAQRVRQAAEQQRQQREQVARAEKAKVDEQAKRDEQLRREQQAKSSAQASAIAEQGRRAAQAKADEESRREQLARREQSRREQSAQRTEQSKRDKLAERAEQMKREQLAKRAEQSKREHLSRRDEAKREQLAKRELLARQAEQSRREELAKRTDKTKREALARHEEQLRREALAKREEQLRREAHAQRVEQARRAADRDAQVLRDQLAKREEQTRREAQEREVAQREAWQRQQQALTEQWRREQQAWEQQQRVRQRPNLREDVRPAAPEIWQRSIPIVSPPGRTS